MSHDDKALGDTEEARERSRRYQRGDTTYLGCYPVTTSPRINSASFPFIEDSLNNNSCYATTGLTESACHLLEREAYGHGYRAFVIEELHRRRCFSRNHVRYKIRTAAYIDTVFGTVHIPNCASRFRFLHPFLQSSILETIEA